MAPFSWDIEPLGLKHLAILDESLALTGKRPVDPGSDTVANTFTFTVSSLSEFVLAAPPDILLQHCVS